MKKILPSKIKKMKVLREKILDCHKCPGLNVSGKTDSAPGFGFLYSPVMIVGQSLHQIFPEFKVQIPFLGPKGYKGCGPLLWGSVEKAGLSFDQLFWTNLVHCFPGRRGLLNSQVKCCKPFLFEEINIVRPDLIICLGSEAMKALLGGVFKLADPTIRIVKFSKGNTFQTHVLGMVHPASFLYNPSKEGEKVWRKKFSSWTKEFWSRRPLYELRTGHKNAGSRSGR